MESKINNWEKQFDNEKLDDDGNVEFSLEEWEPEGIIVEFEPDATLETEVMLIKVSTTKETQTPVIEKATLSNARSVDVGTSSAIFEMTGTAAELDKFEDLMKPYGIIDMVRGGRVAMQGIQS